MSMTAEETKIIERRVRQLRNGTTPRGFDPIRARGGLIGRLWLWAATSIARLRAAVSAAHREEIAMAYTVGVADGARAARRHMADRYAD